MGTRGIKRRLVRLRYQLERLLALLLLVVAPIALVAAFVYVAYLGMTTEGPIVRDGGIVVPPLLAEAWEPIGRHLTPEGEVIVAGTIILLVLVGLALLADRLQSGE